MMRATLFVLLRTTVIFLSFTLDVKVRADVLVTSVSGECEVQKADAVIKARPQARLAEPLSFETFQNGKAQLIFNSMNFVLSANTYVDLSDNREVYQYKGTAFVRTSFSKDVEALSQAPSLKIITPQGVVRLEDAEILLEVSKTRTTISVMKGLADLSDRAGNVAIKIQQGYTQWIGGLTVTGQRERGPLQAIDFLRVAKEMKALGPYSLAELQARYDELRPVWKEAVAKVAEENQSRVAADLKRFSSYLDEERSKEKRQKREQASLRRYFRAKALGVPDEDQSSPSE